MARTTPTHTPPFKYILACLLSIALLFSDLRYETFSLFRGSVQAVGIYSQLFLESFTSKLLVFTYLYEDKKTLVRSNSKLRDQLQEIENKQFLMCPFAVSLIRLQVEQKGLVIELIIAKLPV